jgi:uncharacterized protein YgbK (DUF1537 family)
LLWPDVEASLPAPWPAADLREQIRRRHLASAETLVVVDDDPTGCQTVFDVPILFEWTAEALAAELSQRPAVLYVLTNSRAVPAETAGRINRELGANLRAAAAQTGRATSVVSRSDSTLRGHFPAETDALNAALGPFGGVLLVPYFGDGGRLTIQDVHYLKRGDDLIPAASTEFAQDPVFGYHSSNLREWAAEKSGGRWAAGEVLSLSLDVIRRGGPERLAEQLVGATRGAPIVVNAACDRDLEVVAWALLQAAPGVRLLPRTAASFVKIRAGLPDRALLSPTEIGIVPAAGRAAGLVMVGSYVPQTTAQLERLLAQPGVQGFELEVERLLAASAPEALAADLAERAGAAIAAGQVAVVYTSRRYRAAGPAEATLDAGRRISRGLCEVLRALPVRPDYLIAKGGITSHELAQRGLGCRRATVMGQVVPGVPVWRLDQAERFERLPYVVFPGNVGQADTLRELVARLSAG